jgi:hypothetical protein
LQVSNCEIFSDESYNDSFTEELLAYEGVKILPIKKNKCRDSMKRLSPSVLKFKAEENLTKEVIAYG